LTGTSCELVLLRHGETDWNREGRLQGQTDIALNALGERQALAVAEHLLSRQASAQIHAVYASDLSRASETARAFAQRAFMEVVADARLRERHYGDFEGHRRADLPKLFPELGHAWNDGLLAMNPPRGETPQAFMTRVESAMRSMALGHPGQRVLVATHGGVLDCAYRIAKGLGAHVPRTWPIANASLNIMRWHDGRWHMMDWGRVSHLAAIERIP
jgi:probable phosphoglycerate mutase